MTGAICDIYQEVLGISPDHVYVNIAQEQTGNGIDQISRDGMKKWLLQLLQQPPFKQ